jgi:hypothetical protein
MIMKLAAIAVLGLVLGAAFGSLNRLATSVVISAAATTEGNAP